MSTKIYNGFRMKKMDLNEFNNFYIEMNRNCTEIAHDKYIDFVLEQTTNFLDNLCYFDSKISADSQDNILGIEKMLKYYYNSSLNISTLRTKAILGDNNYYYKTDDEKIKNILESNICLQITDNIREDIIQKDILNERDLDYDYNFELCVFPRENDTLVLVYGDTFIDAFNQYIDKKDGFLAETLAKYDLEYYGYWDNTDPPEGFSHEDWAKRGKEWDDVLAIGKGIPNRAGMSLNLYDYRYDLNIFLLKDNFDKFLDRIPSIEERAKHNAKNIILDNYIMENKPEGELKFSTVSNLTRQFKEEMNTNKELQNRIKNLEDILKNVYPEINKDIIFKKFKDFLPNYNKYKNKEIEQESNR